jgi:membrane associated rhomboid family serine protease
MCFFTAPFFAFDFGDLFMGFLGLFILGADLECSLSRRRFLVCSIGILAGAHLLALAVSFLHWVFILAGPSYLVVGLAVCYAVFSPQARTTILGLTIPITWAPWAYAAVVILTHAAAVGNAVFGLAAGYLAAKLAKLGDRGASGWRRMDGYTEFVRPESPRSQPRGFSGRARRLGE